MPAVPRNILSDVTDLILNHVVQTPQELQVLSNPDKNDRLQPIEEEIKTMKETLADVEKSLNTQIARRKKQRNSLTHFNQLSLEIASNILWLSIADPWPRGKSYSFLQRQQSISSVCSLWRTLVNDSPRFWSIIEFSRPRAAILHFLEKSRSTGLHIKCFAESFYDWEPTMELDPFTKGWFLRTISFDTDRIRSLILSVRSIDGLLDVLEKPAPMLEQLKLDCSGCDFVRPLDLFCGQASRLRDVVLQNIAVEWDSGVFIGLRSLDMVEDLEYLPTEEQMRRLLEANPGLEELIIRGLTITEHFVNDEVLSTAEGKPSRVVMSKMQTLRLLDLPFKLVQAVLGNVEIPSISNFQLRCLFRGVPASSMLDYGIKHLFPTLLRLSKGTQQAQLTFGQSSVGLAIYAPHHESPTVQIELVETMPISGFDWLAANFFHAEDLPSVCAAEIFQVSLKFTDKFDMAGGTFISVLHRLNAIKVKALTIDGRCKHGEQLIKYLGEAKGESQLPLPYLTSMTIGGPGKLADHLSIALQRRMQYAAARERSTIPLPVMLEVLDIRDLREVDEDVEKALAKCIPSSGTFIPGSTRNLIWRLMGLNRAKYLDRSDDEDMEIDYLQPERVSSNMW
ncbi:hypothetical protein FS837_011377 [Tulasnella sp. UAMH 9824]|nr:hypothetical protein FS837_011377 [Tulasnella sp. UAMH 9824]